MRAPRLKTSVFPVYAHTCLKLSKSTAASNESLHLKQKTAVTTAYPVGAIGTGLGYSAHSPRFSAQVRKVAVAQLIVFILADGRSGLSPVILTLNNSYGRFCQNVDPCEMREKARTSHLNMLQSERLNDLWTIGPTQGCGDTLKKCPPC